MQEILAGFNSNVPTWELANFGVGMMGYSRAKDRLVMWGRTRESVEAMPVGQVLALYSSRCSQEIVDREEQLYYVPFSMRNRFEVPRELLQIGQEFEDLLVPSQVLQSTSAAVGAEVRLAREFAALRLIEALRMHAAQHEGKLPTTLEKITCVPVPENPATDKPFVYDVQGTTATLVLPESDGVSPINIRYEIRIVDKEQGPGK